jgi:(p)ppGpp synthase/HD superfamily hydrolase
LLSKKEWDFFIEYFSMHLNFMDKVALDVVDVVDVVVKAMEAASYGHDGVEDARLTYNDIRKNSTLIVAELIYRVTDEKGRNRDERKNERYYAELIEFWPAICIKLLDKMANLLYSKLFKNVKMFEMAKKEAKAFRNKCLIEETEHYRPMFDFYDKMLESIELF